MKSLIILYGLISMASDSQASSPSKVKQNLVCTISVQFKDDSKNVKQEIVRSLENQDTVEVNDLPIDLAGTKAKIKIFYRIEDGATDVMLNSDDGKTFIEVSGGLHTKEDTYGVFQTLSGPAASAIFPQSSDLVIQCELKNALN